MLQLENKKSILVLEDDPFWQETLRTMLKKVDTSFEIRCVPTTQEAIQLLAVGEHFDLVVADQYLDGVMTGLDLYRHMRALKDKTSFVMLSGIGADDIEEFGEINERPLFVSKTNAFKTFAEVVRGEMSEPAAAAVAVAPAPLKSESVFLMLVTASALAFAMSHLNLAPAPPASAVPEDGSRHFNEVKAPILFKPRTPATVVLAPASKTREFVTAQLRNDIKRIVMRAEAIDKKVSAQ